MDMGSFGRNNVFSTYGLVVYSCLALCRRRYIFYKPCVVVFFSDSELEVGGYYV